MRRPQNIARALSSEGIVGTYDIFLVGFPETGATREIGSEPEDLKVTDWGYFIPHLIPEARVYDFRLFEDYVAATGSILPHMSNLLTSEKGLETTTHLPKKGFGNDEYRGCSASCLEKEAYTLLDEAKKSDHSSTWRPIIFVGYRLGGLAVKHAMYIANTNSYYGDIALRAHKFVFRESPHNITDLAVWEEVLDGMIVSAGVKLDGRKSVVLAELAGSVNKMDTYFHCALKYDTVQYIEDEHKTSRWTCQLADNLQTSSMNIMRTKSINEIDLRDVLTPSTGLKKYDIGAGSMPRGGAASFYSDLLDFFQSFSPSNFNTYQSPAFQVFSDHFGSDASNYNISNLRDQNQHSIQIIGPSGQGKTTTMKSLIQKIMRALPHVLLVDTFAERPENGNIDFRTLLRSFIYQLVSQRPELFFHFRPLYLADCKLRHTLTQTILKNYLHIILRAMKNWKIIIAAANVHLWPKEVQNSLQVIEKSLQSESSNYVFIISSDALISNIGSSTRDIIIAENHIEQHQSLSIMEKLEAELIPQSDPRMDLLVQKFRDDIIPRLPSVTDVGRFAKLLTQRIALSTLTEAETGLKDCPKTGDEISRHFLSSLNSDLLTWSVFVISWVHRAARPLRTHELAIAIAISKNPSRISGLTSDISISIETDIQRHLNTFFRVDNDLVYFYNSNVRQFLITENLSGQNSGLLSHEQMTILCLDYIKNVVSGEFLDMCIAEVDWRQQTQDDTREIKFGFLAYAAQHWPTHYRSHVQLRKLSADPENKAKSQNILEENVLAFLADENSTVRDIWYQLFQKKEQSKLGRVISSLEIATELGLSTIVHKLLTDSKSESKSEAKPINIGKLLCSAIANDRSELVDFFLLQTSVEKEDAIVEAAGWDKPEYLEKLLPGDTPESKDEHIWIDTLHRAARCGSLSSFIFFEKFGPEWTWKGRNDPKMLLAAAAGGNVDILKYLIDDREVDLIEQDSSDKTPLIKAAELYNHLFSRSLCNAKVDAALADLEGMTALHYAVFNNPEFTTALFQQNTSPIRLDKRGWTPLHYACYLGNVEIVSHLVNLLKEGDNVDILNKDGDTPLHIAAAGGFLLIVNILLGKAADNALQNGKNETPIDLAATSGHLTVFQALHSDTGSLSDDRLLVQVVSAGQLLVLRYLLEKKSHMNFLVDGISPLAAAAKKGFTEIVRLLLSKKANPNFENSDGSLPLQLAVSKGHFNVTKVLLQGSANPNSLDDIRRTPLHLAVSKNMLNIVQVLLDNGADINARTMMKDTALHLSVPYPDIVKELLQRSPQLAVLNYGGVTPLHLAVQGPYIDSAMLLLQRDGSLLHIPDEEGYTPLHMSLPEKDKDLDVFKMLWKDGVDLQHKAYTQHSLVLYAAEKGNLEALQFLLQQEAALHTSKDEEKYAILRMAIEKGHAELFDALLNMENWFNINFLLKGSSLLHHAADSSHVAAIKKLIAHGANVDVENFSKQTPLYLASWRGHIPSIECLLLDGKANVNCQDYKGSTPLHAGADSIKAIELLIDNGAEVNAQDSRGWSPLMQSVYWGTALTVDALLNHGSQIDMTNDMSETALHLSEAEFDPHVCSILLEAGADVSVRNNDGQTPLHYAARHGRGDRGVTKIEQLLAKKAVVNCKDTQGKTPFHYAAGRAHYSELLVQKFLGIYQENGYDIDERDNEQQTPLHIALLSANIAIVKALFDGGAGKKEDDKDIFFKLAKDSEIDSEQKVSFLVERL